MYIYIIYYIAEFARSNRIRAKKEQTDMSEDVYSLHAVPEIASDGQWKMLAAEISGYIVPGVESRNEGMTERR